MKLPDKFWFYHKSNSSETFFARKMSNEYFITNLKKETFVRFEHEVEEYFSFGHWVLTVPDKFSVRNVETGTTYSMTRDSNDLIVMQDKKTGETLFHRVEDVFNCFYGGIPLWTPFGYVENDTHGDTPENTTVKPLQTNPCEKPDKKPAKKLISINVNAVRAAAEFDVANNPHTKAKGNTIEEIEQEILTYVREMYDALMNGDTEWELHYTGTRTYRILFQPEDDSYGTISILSDTSVGMPTFFADVNDFLSQN